MTDLQRTRLSRAELMLEDDLWAVIQKHHQKRPTKTESHLKRIHFISVLALMIRRLSHELAGFR